jgi:release factor glutamine methyltransferase
VKTLALLLVNTFWRPLVARYISKTTRYRYKNIGIRVFPGVFHPQFFFSTTILLRYLEKITLAHRSFLELGAGSGLISVFAAKKGAQVTASDISQTAVNNVLENQKANHVAFPVFHSDLFTKLPPETFDIIVINPPYYKKNPVSEADHAWYCGENAEYFSKLFFSLSRFMKAQSQVIMVLSDACDLRLITSIAGEHGFELVCIKEYQRLIEKNFLFSIRFVRS